MTARVFNMVAPNSLHIVGVKLDDGTISDFEWTWDARNKVSMYELPSGTVAKLSSENGTVLVDSEGNEWAALDVEFHTLIHGK